MKNTILIVGSAPMRALVVKALHTLQYMATEEAQHGQQAMLKIEQRAATEDPVRVIISEFKMPVLSGPGIINQLKVRGYDIPVVFLSEPGADEAVFLAHSPHLIAQNAGIVRYTELNAKLEELLHCAAT